MADSEISYEDEIVGYVVDESSMKNFKFMLKRGAESKVKFGEYVLVKNTVGEDVLGLISSISSINWQLLLERSSFINENDLMQAIKNLEYARTQEISVAEVQVLGKIVEANGGKEYRISPNREIIRPLEGVRLASNELLSVLFEKQGKKWLSSPEEGGMLPIGFLLSRYDKVKDEGPVKVSLDLQNLLSRHFAILAITGAGKSNTVALMATRIVRDFRGTVLIIDTHGEYSSLSKDEKYKDLINVLPLSIDMTEFNDAYFAELLRIPDVHHYVRECLRSALDAAKLSLKDSVKRGSSKALLNELKRVLESMVSEKEKGADTVLAKLDLAWSTLYNVASDAKGEDTLSHIMPNKLNILDISSLYTDQMAVILQKLLEKIFEYRAKAKRAKVRGNSEELLSIPYQFLQPILVIIEEAHLFVEAGRSEGALSQVKRLISRIAREGRKFGISLGLVSQRPKKIDPDVLSQCNTFIILKLVEGSDKKKVQEASETLSEELVESLDSLDVGEGLIVGSAVKIPAAVKIFKFDGKYSGTDVNFLEEWMKSSYGTLSEDNPDLDRGGKMKVAHLADIHLGSRTYGIEQTYWDPAKAFEMAIEKAVDEKVEAILISGDLFHIRGVNPMEYLMAERALRIAKDQGIPVLAIHGNHDSPSADHPSPYHVLENFGLLSYLDLIKEKPLSWLRRREYKQGDLEIKTRKISEGLYLRYAEIGDVAIYGVGYRIRNIRRNVNAIPFQKFPGEKKVLMLHQTIYDVFKSGGVMFGEPIEGFRSVSDLPPGFSYYALGHFHKPCLSIKPHGGIGAYSGSLCRLSIDDASATWSPEAGAVFIEGNERGFVIKNLEDSQSPRFLRVPFRDFVKIEISEDMLGDPVENALIGIKRCLKAIEERRELVGPPIVSVVFRIDPKTSINFGAVEMGIRQRLANKVLLRITVSTKGEEYEKIEELQKIVLGDKDPLEYAIQEVLKDSPSKMREAIEIIVKKLGEVRSISKSDDVRVIEAYEAIKKIFLPELKESWIDEKEKEEEKKEEEKEYKGSATLI